MKAARQVEAVELMIASNTITVAHAEALLKAPARVKLRREAGRAGKEDHALGQIEKLAKEMSQVQEKYQEAKRSYGFDLLNLVVAKGYPTKLLANGAVKSYIGRHVSEILLYDNSKKSRTNMTSRQDKIQEDTHFRIMRIFQDNPDLTWRELAELLGMSVGGLNCCLNALIDKGF